MRQALILRSPVTTTLWPGDFIELDVPSDIALDNPVALEPRITTYINNQLPTSYIWPSPNILTNIGGKVRIPNDTTYPIKLRKHDQFCHIHQVSTQVESISTSIYNSGEPQQQVQSALPFSRSIILDTDDLLPPKVCSEFVSTNTTYDRVFRPFDSGYNGAVGPIAGTINMGSTKPPQRKGRVPQYNRAKLSDLQDKFDSLEQQGVFRKPEEIGLVVEYLNPSFLVKKPSGGFRLVTAFADVVRFAKPQPSLMPDVNSTLQQIARWKYIVTTDLSSAYYQIPLSLESQKYCGVATPFKGVRVYTRCAMGMPGSETALEELLCRVLGDYIQEGKVAKLADDLYIGGDTPEVLHQNWTLVLSSLDKCNLRLSPAKTVIAPKSTSILGWVWSQGVLSASPHKISTLSTCEPPTTIKQMRSFIGAYKVLARVIPHASHILSPLEDSVAGKVSSDRLQWSEDLTTSFQTAKDLLKSHKSITLPKPTDTIWIVTDGAVKYPGLGATMYITRDGLSPKVAGYFSAKLKQRQLSWIPCELEALAIAATVKHFSPYIIQSCSTACILTDSKPCVDSFEKLCRGEFSTSSRLTTFLTTISRYHISVRHLSGSANTPSDFQSCNAPECNFSNCHVCLFVNQIGDAVVHSVSVQDILSGKAKLPFTTRSTWIDIQSDDPDLRRCHAHLKQGTRPSKKITNAKDLKRYLNVATISRDGLLVVRRNEPFQSPRECIIIPREMFPGLLTALHIKLDHPTPYQLKQVVLRYFYALDLDKCIEAVSSQCHTCLSLKSFPTVMVEQSTSSPPETIGASFAGDVIRRSKQLILVIRETVTSFTSAVLLPSERHDDLRDGILLLCLSLRPLNGPPAVLRTDNAPGFHPLIDDSILNSYGISIELGRTKNPNKNPVIDRCIQELETELKHLAPTGNPVSPTQLSIAVSSLNTRFRHHGVSALEMWTQRDQFTHAQLPISDRDLIASQYQRRIDNHSTSTKSKSSRQRPAIPKVIPGDLVYLYRDQAKVKARDRYLVISVDGEWCNIKKFTDSQLRNCSYRVKLSECYLIPLPIMLHQPELSASCDTDSDPDLPAIQPSIPSELTEVPQVEPIGIHIDNPCPVDTVSPTKINVPIPETREPTRHSARVPHPPVRYGYDEFDQ